MVLYPAIISNTKFKVTYVLIPIVGFLGIISSAVAYQILVADSLSWLSHWIPIRDVDLSAYQDSGLFIPTAILLALVLWMGGSRLTKLASLSKKERPAAITILLLTIVSVGIISIKAQKNGSELFFLFAPLAAITSNYVESGTSKIRRVFNEVFLWSLVIAVLVLPWV